MEVLDDSQPAQELWNEIQLFAARFLRPFSDLDGFPEADLLAAQRRLNLQLPTTLFEFYRRFASARNIWSKQDPLLTPDEFIVRDGVLLFEFENQGNWRIGIRLADLAQADPPVVWDGAWYQGHEDTPISVLAPSVSMFAVNMLAYVAKIAQRADHPAVGYTKDAASCLSALWDCFPRCKLRDNWVVGPVAYFQSQDTFIEVSRADGYVYPILMGEAATERFLGIVEQVPFEWIEPPDTA